MIKFDAQSNESGDSAAPQTESAEGIGGEQTPKAEPTFGAADGADAASKRMQDELDKELLAILAEEENGAGSVEPQASNQPIPPAFDPEELTFRALDEVLEAVKPAAANVIDEDEASTKLELAYAYHKMGDNACCRNSIRSARRGRRNAQSRGTETVSVSQCDSRAE